MNNSMSFLLKHNLIRAINQKGTDDKFPTLEKNHLEYITSYFWALDRALNFTKCVRAHALCTHRNT